MKKFKKKLDSLLKVFEGTHNYHNFTFRLKHTNPSANRYIISIKSSSPFIINDTEFIKVEVTGQSFVLHQIRKMVGISIALVKTGGGSDVILKCFEPGLSRVPMAPGLGLLLERCIFKHYSSKFSASHSSLNFDEKQLQDKIEQFKREFIYKHIAETEKKEKIMVSWANKFREKFSIDPNDAQDNEEPEEVEGDGEE